MPALPGIAGDALDLVRKRPAIAVGAGVAVLVAVRLLNRDDTADASTDAAADESAGLGGGLGSISYPSLPSTGDLLDSGVIAQPAPTPTTPPTPAPSVPYLWARVAPGASFTTYAAGSGCYTRGAVVKTAAGFQAEVSDLGTQKECKRTTSTRLVRVLTGAYAGRIIRASEATISTRYR